MSRLVPALLCVTLIPLAVLPSCAEERDPPQLEQEPIEVEVLGLRFRRIEPGSFKMGSTSPGPRELPGWEKLGQPAHRVTFSSAFWMSVTEVPNSMYEKFDPTSERSDLNSGPDDPVMVFFQDAVRFCAWLTEEAPGTFRLPSEAEWEYACRAGSTTHFCFGNDEQMLSKFAWFSRNSNVLAHPIGTKLPNDWGLHDMHGNVYEWCADHWLPDYRGAPDDGRARMELDSRKRVLRGGSFNDPSSFCRSGLRLGSEVDKPNMHFVGIRVVAVGLESGGAEGVTK